MVARARSGELTGWVRASAGKLRPGEVAWQTASWASVVSDNFVTSVCACCYTVPTADAGLTIQCKECGIAYYCSEECKQAVSAVHAYECKPAWQIVQMTQGKSDTRGARMLIRVLSQRRLELDSAAPAAEPEPAEEASAKPAVWRGTRWADIDKLVSHLDAMSEQKITAFRAIAKGIGRMPVAKDVTEDELVKLVATLQCNSQAIVDLNHHKRGDLLIAPADANHSCNPNCFVAFYGNEVQFRVIREIAKGEELTITYTDLYLPREVRQNKLLSSHCFQCGCSRCLDDASESVDAKLSGFRCKSLGCEGVVTQGATTVCSQCEARYDPRALEATSKQALEMFDLAASTYKEKNFEEARRQFEAFMGGCGSELHPGHTLIYNALHQLMSVCNALQDAQAGADYAKQAIAALVKVYPPYHSEVAMMHAALAQVCASTVSLVSIF